MPQLSIVIPSKSPDASDLQRLQASLSKQSFQDFEILVETSGNSEEAKATAALRASGDIIAFFCADNDLRDQDFLRTMVWYAQLPDVTGAYTAQYDYVSYDPALNRYFALIGANDPLCWWLGKADRWSYLTTPHTMVTTLRAPYPSAGDNGCFIKKSLLLSTPFTTQTFGSCMDRCQAMAEAGHARYWIVSEQKLWHRTGDSFLGYLMRRYHYVKTLYFEKEDIRRWHMVEGWQDWFKVFSFAIASFLLVPHLWVSVQGYRRVRDKAWFFHPVVSFCIAFIYTFATFEYIGRKIWSNISVSHWPSNGDGKIAFTG